MKTIKLLVLSIALISSISACKRSDREPLYVTPKSEAFLGIIPYDKFKARAYKNQLFTNTPADTEDNYSRGYQAGCQTMMSALGEGLFRTRGPKIDPEELTNNAWYLRGYEDGANFCHSNTDWEMH